MTSPGAVLGTVHPRTEIGWGGEMHTASPAAAGTMGSTLETLTQRLWEGTWAGGAPCPVCSGQLRLNNGRGVCDRCGSSLF